MNRRLPLPVVVTFDLIRPRPRDLNRIRGTFERLGWERLGNTAYRYPRLRDTATLEDWFNRVIPALMMLRAYSRFAAATGRGLARFTIDANSSTGFSPVDRRGDLPRSAAAIAFIEPSRSGEAMGQQNLQDWLDGIEWPYAEDVQEDAGP
jgi:hypothetical protein